MKPLYSHNQQACEKVMESFRTNRKAAVVHATGTGKSYIIAAVADNFDRVCVIAPNNFVLNETRKTCKEGVEFYTYAALAYGNYPEGQFDLIVLDEFHRSGAEEWGKGCRNFIDANPNAKILGTSATAIRQLDNERNMADEMFDGNVVSHLPVSKAIDLGILPVPCYVSALYDIKKTSKKYEDKIATSEISESMRKTLATRLKKIELSWSGAYGIGHIFRKYLDKNTKRMIVFCARVNRVKETKELMTKWLSFAGFTNITFYDIYSSEANVEYNMQKFESDSYCNGGIKVAISVNMLNEGVHVADVDAVVLLRETKSRIIVEQQIGRCLTAKKAQDGVSPVVFDFVNNMEYVKFVSGKITFAEMFADDMNFQRKRECGTTTYEPNPFKVYDECKDIRAMFEELDSLLNCKFNLYLEELKKFVKENGRLPENNIGATMREVCLWAFVDRRNNYGQEKVTILLEEMRKLGFYILHRWSNREILDYFKENMANRDSSFKWSMWDSFNKRIEEGGVTLSEDEIADYDIVKETLDSARAKRKFSPSKLVDFARENGRLPKPADGYVYNLISKLRDYASKGMFKEEVEELSKYGFSTEKQHKKSANDYLKEFEGICSREGSVPYYSKYPSLFHAMNKLATKDLQFATMYNAIKTRYTK